jgi:hypothetical protein
MRVREGLLYGNELGAGLKAMRCSLLAVSLVALSGPVLGQVIPPTIPQQPVPPTVNSPLAPPPPPSGAGLPPSAATVGLPPSNAPSGIEPDLRRVYGDDAPPLGGLDILAGIGFDIVGTLVTEYNDNVLRRADDAVLAPGESRTDVLFRPTVTVNAGRGFGRQQLFVNSTLGRDIYVRNEQLNKTRFLVNGGLLWSLGQRCSGRVQGGWSTRGTQFDLFEEVVPSTQDRSTFFANASCQTAGGLAPTIAYDRSKVRNSAGETSTGQTVDRSFADVDQQGVSGGIGYTFSSRGQAGVQLSWSEFEYPNQLLPDGSPNSTEITNWNFYGNYRVGSSLRVNGSLGYSNVNPKSALSQSFKGSVWNLGIDYTGPRLGAGISAGRNVSGSNGGQANYQIAEFINGSVTYRFNERMDMVAGFSRTDQQDRGFAGVPETGVLRSFTIDRVFLGADYRMNRILSFGLDVNYQNRVSRPASLSYDAAAVQFTVRAAF